jgi:hypothetical protein
VPSLSLGRNTDNPDQGLSQSLIQTVHLKLGHDHFIFYIVFDSLFVAMQSPNAVLPELPAAICFHSGFLLGLFFDPEDGSDMFLRNVS